MDPITITMLMTPAAAQIGKLLNTKVAELLSRLKVAPQDPGRKRVLDNAPWTGVPTGIADGHTYEGNKLATLETLLSGTYCNHAVLGQRVNEGRLGIDPQ